MTHKKKIILLLVINVAAFTAYIVSPNPISWSFIFITPSALISYLIYHDWKVKGKK